MKITINELKQYILCEISKDKIKSSFKSYVKNNNKDKLEKLIPILLDLQKQDKYKELLSTGTHTFAYRLIDFQSEKQLKDILDVDKVNKEKYTVIKDKVLKSQDRISSWTVNPRSLVYSGFLSVVPVNSHIIILKAKIDKNKFIGNPDSLTGLLNVGEGYSLEREILGIDDIHYEEAVYGFKEKNQSLEGLTLDLINILEPLEDIEYNKNYYFPKKL